MKHELLIDCPHCGKNTFAVREAVMDGWVKKGEVLKCASCGKVIGPCAEETEEGKDAPRESDAKRQALAALLGGGDAPENTSAEFLAEEKHFCRDCAFRVMNAFRIRCMKHEKDVNPMDDCPDFRKRGEEPETHHP